MRGTKLTLTLLALLLAGCASVYSPAPVGTEPVQLAAEEWDGTWLVAEGAAVVEVTDAARGKLKLAFIEGMEMEVVEIELRRSGEWLFGSYIEADEAPTEEEEAVYQPRFLWGRIQHQSNQVIIWIPDPAKIRPLVEDGTLPGKVTARRGFAGRDVYLGKLLPEHYAIITGETRGVLMDWEHPLVLIRHSR